MDMPIQFSVFEEALKANNYSRIIDQRNDTKPANIYAVWTRNNVKAEIKAHTQKKIVTYVVGQGLSSEKLQILETELTTNNFTVTRNKQHLLVTPQEDILAGFLTFVSYIEDIEGIAARQASARLGIEFDPNQTHLFIAKMIKLAIEMKQPWIISRGAGGFDAIDKKVTKGYSVAGRKQEASGKNAYREHVNPCDNMLRQGIKMLRENATEQDVATMFDLNHIIMKISDEEANLLDNVLGLKTTMPEGWNFGDDPLARLHHASIILENNA